MKKRIAFILLALVFLSIFSLIILEKKVFIKTSGKAIKSSGKATSSFGINISVIAGTTPTLTIEKPQNETYIYYDHLEVKVDTNAVNSWFNVDKGTNISYNSSGKNYLNSGSGSRTLYFFANNSNGTTLKSVNFSIDTDILTMDFSKFIDYDDVDDDNTNLYEFSYKELQNLSGMKLSKKGYGKIIFNSVINLTSNGATANLSQHINISGRRIELNSTALSIFNVSATLYLYNLTFSEAKIKIDGIECPASICTKNSYSGGTLNFTVAHFTTFEVEEGASSVSSDDSSGGGGGGSPSIVKTKVVKDFSVNKETISIALKQGQIKSEQVIIKNTGTRKETFFLSSSGIRNLILFKEKVFELNPGQSKKVDIDFISREADIPGLYSGKIIVKSENIEKEILIAIDINPINALLDIKAEIPKESIKIESGKKIPVDIQILNFGEQGRINVDIFYLIKDIGGEILSAEDETILIENQASFTKEIKIPNSINPGDYLLQIKVNYHNETASSSEWFSVVSKEGLNWKNKALIVFIILLITAIILISFTFKKRR